MMGRTVRWGVLGVSGIAQDKVLPALAKARNARAELLGTRSPQGRAAVAERFGIARGAVPTAEVLADPDVDAVYVSLPNSLHAEWVVRALEAGKPVLCDKPLALNGGQAQQVADASVRTGLPVMEGFMYRFHPQNVFVRDRIADGSIGQVREVHAQFYWRMLELGDINDIRITDGAGAGALMDMGCYTVSAVRMAMGAEPVAAVGWQHWHEELDINVGGAAILTFPDGRLAQVSWGYDVGGGSGLQVIGTRATLEVPCPFVPGQGNPAEAQVVTQGDGGRRTVTEFSPADQFQLEFEEFSAALLEGRPPAWTVADAVANAKAIDLLRDLPRLPTNG